MCHATLKPPELEGSHKTRACTALQALALACESVTDSFGFLKRRVKSMVRLLADLAWAIPGQMNETVHFQINR